MVTTNPPDEPELAGIHNEDLDQQDRRDARTKWAVGLALIACVLLGALLALATDRSQQSAENSDSQKLSLAQQVAAACARPDVNDATLKPLCDNAKNIIKRGDSGPQGPPGPVGLQGPQGDPGLNGLNGRDATDAQVARSVNSYCSVRNGCLGPQGPAGRDGTDGADGVNGVDGLNGVDGVDGAPGPAGPKGDTGAVGPAGPAGSDGRGITSVQCIDDETANGSHWEITYTDGATQSSDGPCRTKDSGIGPLPTP